MKKLFAVAGIALAAAACAESPDPTAFEVQHTIQVPGNTLGTAGCAAIDFASCFAILDNQLKILYERTAWAARRGEAEYRVITGTNKNLSVIYQAQTATASEAVRALDKFVTDITSGLDEGSVSACWGDHLVAFAGWLRDKIANGDVDVSDAPQMTCWVSPPSAVAVKGSEANGVTLTLTDPWQFTGDPYGVYQTQTWFVVTGPNGTITTPAKVQTGAENVVIADPATNVVGTYAYSVVQCADWGQCSAPFEFEVTVENGAGTSDPGCVHDNRDKNHRGPNTLPMCKKGKKS